MHSGERRRQICNTVLIIKSNQCHICRRAPACSIQRYLNAHRSFVVSRKHGVKLQPILQRLHCDRPCYLALKASGKHKRRVELNSVGLQCPGVAALAFN